MTKLVLIAVTLASPTHAALTASGNLVVDDSTGLMWLDLSETNSQSNAYVLSQMTIGGAYEDYRYATLSEVQGLMGTLGFPIMNAQVAGTSLLDETQNMANLFGDTGGEYWPGGYIGSLGFLNISNESNELIRIGALYRIAYSYTSVQTGDSTFLADGGYLHTGHWLVAESVPEPSSVALLGLGGLALMVRRRR